MIMSRTFLDPEILYPESDGLPMAENTEQYEWIVKIKENLEILYANNNNVFIAGDLFWYPEEDKTITGPVAPDVMLVYNRPKGRRGSYKQWEEDNIPPSVVFEILSPSNSKDEMEWKLHFYEKYGVEEYYVYDPRKNKLEGWLRAGEIFSVITNINNWVSPRMGIRFQLGDQELEIFHPDGQKFLTTVELEQLFQQEKIRAQREKLTAQQERERAQQEREKAQQEQEKAQQERERAQQERERAQQEQEKAQQERERANMALAQLEEERQKAQKMAEYLRQMGINPDELS